MKNLIETIAKSLVDRPEEVTIKEIDSERTTIFEIRVAKEDVGKMIGKQGKTAAAIRTIVNANGAKLKRHFVLEII